jgi:putative ABC transport system substrate-binding protein
MKRAVAPLFSFAVILLAGAVIAEAQQVGKTPRIGILVATSPGANTLVEPFRQGLHELGYVEGKNVAPEYRYAEGKLDRLPDLAAELVSVKVNVIVTQSPPAVAAAHRATKTIPIVMVGGGDPVEQGFVKSLARPGGNLTGLSSMSVELAGKRLEIFKGAFPRITRLAVLWSGTSGGASGQQLKDIESAAPAFGIRIRPVEVPRPDDFDKAFSIVTKERPDALFIIRSPFLRPHLKRVTDFAEKSRLPTMYDDSVFVDAGGLMSYGPSLTSLSRRAAIYVDKILKGTKPADIPVEQPMKFEFVVNLKTAKQLGLTISPNVLVRADRVIR